MNKADLYHNMTTLELNEKLLSLKQELFNLRFQHSTGQLKNPLQLSTVKKDIARAMTILRERELNVPKNSGKEQQTKKQEPKVEADKKKKSGGKA